MAPEKTQHAIRRSTRLTLEISVHVTNLDGDIAFSEECRTTLVNAHGCGMIAPCKFMRGIRVQIEILSAKQRTTARVADVVSLGGDPETWLIGLELDVPGNFWGIDYAPSDWKIDEIGTPSAEPKPADREAIAVAKPTRSRPWRLTDISARACYLETAAPFPAGTPVLLSIRSMDTECLLNGVVRVSHEHSGMGIEFTGAPTQNQQAVVQQLIGRLTSSHEVPKIFVGRKEHGKEDGKACPPGATLEATHDAESRDPLLQLIHSGSSLTEEKFMQDLRTQRVVRGGAHTELE